MGFGRSALVVLFLPAVLIGCRNEGADLTTGTTGPSSAPQSSSASTSRAIEPTNTTSSTGSTTREGSCSAAGLAPTVPDQELPGPVADTRRSIVRAAVACDYEALAQIASMGTGGFSYSFGETGAPAEFWQRAEARGERVLRALVEVLRMPFASRTLNEATQYVWPSAHNYERWADVPHADREALSRLYDEDRLRAFQQFGSYTGHRVGIDGAGAWMFFVAGD